jgi:hypothetical protein
LCKKSEVLNSTKYNYLTHKIVYGSRLKVKSITDDHIKEGRIGFPQNVEISSQKFYLQRRKSHKNKEGLPANLKNYIFLLLSLLIYLNLFLLKVRNNHIGVDSKYNKIL